MFYDLVTVMGLYRTFIALGYNPSDIDRIYKNTTVSG